MEERPVNESLNRRINRLKRRNILFVCLLLPTMVILASSYGKTIGGSPHFSASVIKTRKLKIIGYGDKPNYFNAGMGSSVIFSGINIANSTSGISFSTELDGEPGFCVSLVRACRVYMGDLYRNNMNNREELNMQLRNNQSKTLWIPETVNKYVPNYN